MIIIRIWHQLLLPYLPRQQLLGQHRECCALRGAGWGKRHSIVNYVFSHKPVALIAYHYLVMDEMERRGYHPDPIWRNSNWRGNKIGYDKNADWMYGNSLTEFFLACEVESRLIYEEHNDEYLKECLENLKGKGIEITL